MTHPEELLAGYVDGTLGDDERAVVVAHLEGCAACREEVELARTAVQALAALEEEPVPLGVTGPVLSEAGRRSERRRTELWGRVQWIAGAAAAAALVLVVAVSLDLGGSDDEAARTLGGDAAAESAVPAPEEGSDPSATIEGVEQQIGVNYTDEGLRALAQESAVERDAMLGATAGDGAAGATGATGATGGAGEAETEDEGGDVAFAGPGPAIACLRSAGAPVDAPRDRLIRLIEAEYEGTPSYIAVFSEGPGADQAADRVVIWVISTGDCQILTLLQQAL